jgi:hypothetical protein
MKKSKVGEGGRESEAARQEREVRSKKHESKEVGAG